MSKIKNILIKLEFEGNGIVNYDSNDQKYMWNKTDNVNSKLRYENTSFAKKSFYMNDDNTLGYRLKVSSDCLKHDMFKNDMISKNPNILHHPMLLHTYIASPVAIISGYLFASKDITLKKSSPITLCDAEQTCNAVSTIEVFSRSGQKETNEGSDKSDNSFYNKETVGNIKYATIGNIDIMKLQFISCDDIFDRKAFNSDEIKLYKEMLDKKMTLTSELAYYQLNNSIVSIPEHGIMLSDENQIFLVKEALKRMLSIDIRRKNAYCKLSSLKIKLVVDPLVDTFNSPDNWITIDSLDTINSLTFEPYVFYEQIDMDKATVLRNEYMEKLNEIKKSDKDKKSQDRKNKSQKNVETENND